jgi:hypothetical protein
VENTSVPSIVLPPPSKITSLEVILIQELKGLFVMLVLSKYSPGEEIFWQESICVTAPAPPASNKITSIVAPKAISRAHPLQILILVIIPP